MAGDVGSAAACRDPRSPDEKSNEYACDLRLGGNRRREADHFRYVLPGLFPAWLGFVPDEVASAPPAAVARVAERLNLDAGALRGYGRRAQTRSDHLSKVAKYLSWKTAPDGSREMKELEQFLLDRAMEHDSPTLLFNLAREDLMSAKVIRPGAVTLAKMAGTACAGATELTSRQVEHLLTMQVRRTSRHDQEAAALSAQRLLELCPTSVRPRTLRSCAG